MRVVSESTLAQFRGRPCELCGREPGEPAHYLARGMGSGSRLDLPENLACLCRRCHDRLHGGNIPTSIHLDLIAWRLRRLPEEVLVYLWKVKRLPKGSELPEMP